MSFKSLQKEEEEEEMKMIQVWGSATLALAHDMAKGGNGGGSQGLSGQAVKLQERALCSAGVSCLRELLKLGL